MDAPTTNPVTIPTLLSAHRALLDILTSFLTVTTHHILYLRRIYPPVSFIPTRAYNYPVRKNRHPDVCTWINDAVAAIRHQLERNTVDKISICIFECDHNRVLERWTFDMHAFPTMIWEDRDVSLTNYDDPELDYNINSTDLQANFRATLSRISNSASKLRPLPEGDGAPECSFTVTMEVKESAERPVGRMETKERRWVAAEPKQFNQHDKSEPQDKNGEPEQGSRTHAVRRLEAGELKLEVWVEESTTKFSYPLPQWATLEPKEKFDPEHGYPLEKPNIYRNRGEGIGTDYQRG